MPQYFLFFSFFAFFLFLALFRAAPHSHQRVLCSNPLSRVKTGILCMSWLRDCTAEYVVVHYLLTGEIVSEILGWRDAILYCKGMLSNHYYTSYILSYQGVILTSWSYSSFEMGGQGVYCIVGFFVTTKALIASYQKNRIPQPFPHSCITEFPNDGLFGFSFLRFILRPWFDFPIVYSAGARDLPWLCWIWGFEIAG